MNKKINIYKRTLGHLQTLLVISFFLLVVFYFYLAPRVGFTHNTIFGLIALSLLTDGIFLLLHLPRKPVKHYNLSFDPEKLTIIIACYNGEDIIGDTIQEALVHVKPEQIIVVSDASTDRTAETARAYGVQVVENEKNVNKAFSISFVVHHVKTPYVLLLDDDTLIGKTFIPTSLLDDGYDAVAFNVMPIKTNSLVNKLQIFEYRKSMVMGKSLRASAGAVGNVSGAIGLYRTGDLVEQATKHSGQFGGEDQQRTSFVHLYGKGKGITFTDATVLTKAPDTIKQLFRQRSFRWNLSLPELFFVYLKILVSPNFHYLLKIEKAYQMYLLSTDPVRMLFFGVVFFHPFQSLRLYFLYTFFTFIVWLKLARKDPFWLIFVFPIYSALESGCRFIAHFYWFKIKYHYLFKKKFHKLVSDRKLIWEYSGVLVLLVGLWSLSLKSLGEAGMNAYYAIVPGVEIITPKNTGIDNTVISYSSIAKAEESDAQASPPPPSPEEAHVEVTVEEGDGKTNIARKAISIYIAKYGVSLTKSQSRIAENNLRKDMKDVDRIFDGQIIRIENRLIENHVQDATSQR